MKYRKALLSSLAVAAVVAQTGLVATQAQAATARWWSGTPCHNTWYYESGASTSQSRTGQAAAGGGFGGTSQITVYFGTYGTSAWAGSAQVNGPRSYAKGRFKVVWNGGRAGECASSGYGQAVDVGRPGSDPTLNKSASTPATLESSVVEDWAVKATGPTNGSLVTVTAAKDGYSIVTEFTEEQIAAGDASFLIHHALEDSKLVTYDPTAEESFTIKTSSTLPTPGN